MVKSVRDGETRTRWGGMVPTQWAKAKTEAETHQKKMQQLAYEYTSERSARVKNATHEEWEKERTELQKMGGKLNLLFSSTAIRAMEVSEREREREREKE